ncbi:hypothetical protein LINGRAHAP2_LOCUS1743 [Linum grandiflorum]
MKKKFGAGKPPTGTPSLGWSCVVVIISLLSGASIVHNIYKPDLVSPISVMVSLGDICYRCVPYNARLTENVSNCVLGWCRGYLRWRTWTLVIRMKSRSRSNELFSGLQAQLNSFTVSFSQPAMRMCLPC